MKSESVEVGEKATVLVARKINRGFGIFDLILRIFGIVGTLASAAAMGTTDETLNFSTQFFQFQAQYDDFDSFKLFVITNTIVCGYLALSLPISIIHIIRSHARKSRIFLIFLDVIMLALLTGGASAAAAIVYLAHNGNASANWFAICGQFQDFCKRSAGSLIGSFLAIVVFVLLIILSTVVLSRH